MNQIENPVVQVKGQGYSSDLCAINNPEQQDVMR